MLFKHLNLNLGAYCSSVAQPLAGQCRKSSASCILTSYSFRGEKRLAALSLASVTPGKKSLGLGIETICMSKNSLKTKCVRFITGRVLYPKQFHSIFLENKYWFGEDIN